MLIFMWMSTPSVKIKVALIIIGQYLFETHDRLIVMKACSHWFDHLWFHSRLLKLLLLVHPLKETEVWLRGCLFSVLQSKILIRIKAYQLNKLNERLHALLCDAFKVQLVTIWCIYAGSIKWVFNNGSTWFVQMSF